MPWAPRACAGAQATSSSSAPARGGFLFARRRLTGDCGVQAALPWAGSLDHCVDGPVAGGPRDRSMALAGLAAAAGRLPLRRSASGPVRVTSGGVGEGRARQGERALGGVLVMAGSGVVRGCLVVVLRPTLGAAAGEPVPAGASRRLAGGLRGAGFKRRRPAEAQGALTGVVSLRLLCCGCGVLACLDGAAGRCLLYGGGQGRGARRLRDHGAALASGGTGCSRISRGRRFTGGRGTPALGGGTRCSRRPGVKRHGRPRRPRSPGARHRSPAVDLGERLWERGLVRRRTSDAEQRTPERRRRSAAGRRGVVLVRGPSAALATRSWVGLLQLAPAAAGEPAPRRFVGGRGRRGCGGLGPVAGGPGDWSAARRCSGGRPSEIGTVSYSNLGACALEVPDRGQRRRRS